MFIGECWRYFPQFFLLTTPWQYCCRSLNFCLHFDFVHGMVCSLEYFSVIFNILLVLINLSVDGIRLISCHIPEQNAVALRVCVAVKLLCWSFIYLNWLPFQILIPTLYGRKFHLWLNIFLWFWYGTGVWNSVGSIKYSFCPT